MVALTDRELDQLIAFQGYGTNDATTWFLGMEEAGGGEDNLRLRLKFDDLEDCAEAHQKLGNEIHHEGKKIIQRTWPGMCCVMLGLDGTPMGKEDIRNYQANQLGRRNGSTLLAEVMPIPMPKVSEWHYSEILPQFQNRSDYFNQVWPRRRRQLRQMFDAYAPRVVICYGSAYWRVYEELFDTKRFDADGLFKTSVQNSSLIVLTPHFTARSMNGTKPYEQLVAIIQKWANQ